MFQTSLKTAFLFLLLAFFTPAQSLATGYVALGDDFSSGVGAGSYDSGSGACKRSTRSFPSLWAAAHSPSAFAFTACAGARTGDVLRGQLDPLSSATTLVSLTIGANDAGLADTLTTCAVQGESACLSRIAQARSYIAMTLPDKLDQVYSAIRRKAPHAHVVVLGYPRLYKLSVACSIGLPENSKSAINALIDELNSVTAKRAADHGFSFGRVDSTFAGHEICSSSSWLHSGTFPVDERHHPTAAGQSAGYLPVFAAAA